MDDLETSSANTSPKTLSHDDDNEMLFLSDDDTFLRDDDDDALIAALQLTAASCLLLADAIDIEEEEIKTKRPRVKPYRKSRNKIGSTQSLMFGLEPNKVDFKNFIRMDEESFNFILSLIRPDIVEQDTVTRNAITPEEKLAITLRFLATGENYMEFDYNSKLSKSYLSGTIIEVCEAIFKHLNREFLKFPKTEEEWLTIAHHYNEKYQFPHCLGALDGKHIAFRPSKKDAPLFYNYKGFHSIVLLGIADAYAKFIFIDFGCNGRISDGGVLQRSNLMYILQQPEKYLPQKSIVEDSIELPYVFVADNAFPLAQNLMTPYPFSTNDDNKKVYNRRLSRARQTIERAFGILSNRFQIFQKPIKLHQNKVKLIVRCCCVLHNFLITMSPWYSEQNISELAKTATPQQVADGCLNTRNSKTGENVRTNFKQYFTNEGGI